MSAIGRLLACSLLCAFLYGCATPQQRAHNNLQHVVVVWLREPGNTVHREKILSASDVLRDIPGVQSLHSGTVVPGKRDIVDSSFDVALIVSFADRPAMDAYLTHPVHVKLVNETLQPLVAKIRVYDFM